MAENGYSTYYERFIANLVQVQVKVVFHNQLIYLIVMKSQTLLCFKTLLTKKVHNKAD